MIRLLLVFLTLMVAPTAGAASLRGYGQQVERVAPGVWLFRQPRFLVQPAGNVTVIEQSQGLVVIDTGGSPGAARRLIAQIRDLSPKPVTAIVITHWHGDHVQGLAQFLQAWPNARTIATGATRTHLATPGAMNSPAAPDPAADARMQASFRNFAVVAADRSRKATTPVEQTGWTDASALFTLYAEDMRGALTLQPSEAFSDRLRLSDPIAPVELRFLGRANTDGDAIAWLPRQRVVVTGDIVVLPFPYGYGGYPSDWLKTLSALEALPFRHLVPGHGPVQRDRAAISRLRRSLSEVQAQVGPLAGRGLSLDETRKRVDLTAQRDRYAGDDPWLRRWVTEFWINPIVTSAWREARGEPIIQSLGGG